MSNQDIFNRSTEVVGFSPITFSEATLQFGSGGATSKGMLAQNVTIQYSALNDLIREIGSKNFYYAEKFPTIQVQIARLVGSGKNAKEFFSTEFWEGPSDGQSGANITIKSTTGNLGYVIQGCIIIDFGINVGSGDEYVQESIVLQGVSLLDA